MQQLTMVSVGVSICTPGEGSPPGGCSMDWRPAMAPGDISGIATSKPAAKHSTPVTTLPTCSQNTEVSLQYGTQANSSPAPSYSSGLVLLPFVNIGFTCALPPDHKKAYLLTSTFLHIQVVRDGDKVIQQLHLGYRAPTLCCRAHFPNSTNFFSILNISIYPNYF